jgi:hypothetical protein
LTDPRLAKLREIDDALAEKGWPRISPWWWDTIEAFYESGVLGGVITGGRRGGKSSTLCGKVAVAELITTVTNDKGEERPLHDVPPGDVGYFAMVSAEKPQAKARLATCKKALVALGYSLAKDNTEEIVLSGSRLGVQAVTASLTGVVSFTCIGALLDEMALWADDDGANPADAVVKSLKPTMATMPYARAWYVSAPWAEMGLHYEMSQAGDTPTQRVFHGATWEMNPTLTEEATHLLEEDFPSWQRGYAAIPMPADETKFFSATFVDAAAKARQLAYNEILERTAAGGDFAFRRNSSALAVLAKYTTGNLRLATCEERIPGRVPLVPSQTITDLGSIAVSYGADAIACDLHYIDTVKEHVADLELPLIEYPAEQNAKAYVRLRVLLSKGQIDLSKAPKKLLSQLKETTSKPLDGGGMSIKNKTVAGAHGDLVSALVAGIWALDQPVPEDKMAVGERRYPRNAPEDEPSFDD